MKIGLDEIIFDGPETVIRVGSWKRRNIEKTAAGLNGAISIELGLSCRNIVQEGVIGAISAQALSKKTANVNGKLDDSSHQLSIDGEIFNNIRVDSFEVTGLRCSGANVFCEYKISYTQLGNE